MSVNICLETVDYQPHPNWDHLTNGGHKAFAWSVLPHLPCVEHRRHPNPWVDDTVLYRPADFEAWRRGIQVAGLPNIELFQTMVDLLEQDERYWIRISF